MSFFPQVLQVQMNDYKYHYHLTSFDIEIFDLENIKYNFVNLTAFRIVDSTNPMVKQVLRDIERFSPKGKQILNRTNVIQAGPALMFDSVYALAKGVHSLQKSAPRSMIHPTNASCDTEVPWMDGSSLYNYINSVRTTIRVNMSFLLIFDEYLRFNFKDWLEGFSSRKE